MVEEYVEDIIAEMADDPVKTESDITIGMQPVAEIAAAATEALNTKTESEENTEESANAQTGADENNDPAENTADKDPTAADAENIVKQPAAETQTVEELATQLGWRKDHTGEGAVDAATYILRSKDIQTHLKNKLTHIQGTVDALKEHNERVYKADLKKKEAQIAQLKAEKRAAVELADADKVDALDEQIDTLKEDLNTRGPEVQPTGNPIYDEWVKDNQWYLTDNDMAAYADTVAQQYAGAPADRIYALVRNKVAEVFPEKFTDVPKPPANQTVPPLAQAESNQQPAQKPVGPAGPVEPATPKRQSKSFTRADLSAEQVAIMNQFVRGGVMTEDQYIADIAKMQEA